MENEIEARIFGRVQMVLYRTFVERHARSLALRGYVKNLADGSVTVVAQGPRAALEELIEQIHKGPFLAKVERVEVVWREPSQHLEGFYIAHD